MSIDNPGEPEWLQIGVAAALAQKYAADQRQLLETLAQMLSAALPQATRIERTRSLFGPRPIKRLIIQLNDATYTLEVWDSRPISASWTHFVRGIALKTEDMQVDEWLSRLGAALDDQARLSAATRDALSRMLQL
jgi:hypothetical protein